MSSANDRAGDGRDQGRHPEAEGNSGFRAGHNLPTIELRIGETERIVDEIEAALIGSDRGLYRRGGLIVSTGFDKMQTWDGKTIEVQIIEERSNYALLEDIEAVANFVRFDARTERRQARSPPMRAGAHAQAADDTDCACRTSSASSTARPSRPTAN